MRRLRALNVHRNRSGCPPRHILCARRSTIPERWDLVQLHCSDFLGCALEERVAFYCWSREKFGIRDVLGCDRQCRRRATIRLNCRACHVRLHLSFNRALSARDLRD
jgi:hypothetical protein